MKGALKPWKNIPNSVIALFICMLILTPSTVYAEELAYMPAFSVIQPITGAALPNEISRTASLHAWIFILWIVIPMEILMNSSLMKLFRADWFLRMHSLLILYSWETRSPWVSKNTARPILIPSLQTPHTSWQESAAQPKLPFLEMPSPHTLILCRNTMEKFSI